MDVASWNLRLSRHFMLPEGHPVRTFCRRFVLIKEIQRGSCGGVFGLRPKTPPQLAFTMRNPQEH